MYGIFMESLVILRNYGGRISWMLLYAAALVFLFVREKTAWKRYLLVYAPLALLLLFLLPVTRKVYVALMDEGATYYRLLWLVPFGVTVAYAAVKLFEKHLRAGLAVSALCIALCGSLVYKSVHISRAENIYHLPQTVIELCDAVLSGTGEDGVVRAAFPSELVHYVRQYDTRIVMPFGRDMVEPVWDYWNLVYSAMEEPEVIDMEKLTEELRKEKCDHLVLRRDRKTDVSPEEKGWKRVAETGTYLVFADTEATEP